jgi:hypothetical protein
MNLRVLQALFIVSWLGWACMPLWGAVFFAALEVAVLLGLTQKNLAGRATLKAELQSVIEPLPAEARTFLEKHAFFYTQRAAAKEWSAMLRAVGLAALLLVPVFAVHALLRSELKLLIPVLPALVFFFLNAVMAPALEVDQWTKDEGKAAERALHESVTAALAPKTAATIAELLSRAGPRLSAPPGGGGPPPGDGSA